MSCHPEREPFLRCLLTGLPLNVAQRVVVKQHAQHRDMASKNSSGAVVSTYRPGGKIFTYSTNAASNPGGNDALITGDASAPYRTMKGHQPVHIHPSSVLFSMVNSRKLPEYVVFAEILITSKQYMRNLSVVDGPWLSEMLPTLFRPIAQTNDNNAAVSLRDHRSTIESTQQQQTSTTATATTVVPAGQQLGSQGGSTKNSIRPVVHVRR